LQGAGASIETHMHSGATPLVIASQKNYRYNLSYFSSAPSSPNIIEFFYLIYYNREIVEFLLRKGAKTGVVGASSMNCIIPSLSFTLSHFYLPALHLASFNGHVECIRMLLEAAASTGMQQTTQIQFTNFR